MREKSGSGVLRWLTACGPAIAAVPIALAWRGEAARQAESNRPLDWPAVDGVEWTVPGEIAVQFKPGTGDNALADLGQRLGVPMAWDGATGRETGIAELTVPVGIGLNTALASLRADS